MFAQYPFQDSRLYTSQEKKDLLSDEKQQRKRTLSQSVTSMQKLFL